MGLSFYNAALQVLQEANEALDVAEITERALAAQMLARPGPKPAASMQSLLATDLSRRGDRSAFLLVAPATYALREWGDAAPGET